MLEAANEAARDQQRENEETVRQIEIDADKEILAMRLNYEKTLREEREHGLEVKVCSKHRIVIFFSPANQNKP